MQYSSFIGDHIPCRYKSLIEESALRQLVFASEDPPKLLPEFIAEFRNRSTKGKSNTSLQENVKRSHKKAAQEEHDAACKKLSLQDVFRLIASTGKCTRSFQGWVICPILHDKPILFGLPDDPKARIRRFNSLYLNSLDDYPTKHAKSSHVTLNNALLRKTSTLNLNRAGQKSATKVRSCHVSTSENNSPASRTKYSDEQTARPASSAPVRDQRNIECSTSVIVDRNPSDREIALVDFQHDDGEEEHVATYRDGYTYRKILEQRPRSSSTSSRTQSPAGCSSPQQSSTKPCLLSIKGSLGSPKSAPHNTSRGTAGTKDKCKHTRTNRQTDSVCNRLEEVEMEPKFPIRWQVNQRFRDVCDPQLTINNPSPTEVAVLCRIPQMIHKSSPSIPSNTNGKFGGKAKDKPYPFQLHISAASCQVQNGTKKAAKSLVNFT